MPTILLFHQVSRTFLDSAGDSELPWSEQWPIIKKAFDLDTTHTSGLASLGFFWKGLSVLLWIRYPYTVLEWGIRKSTTYLLENHVNHKGQGKQTLSPTTVQRISVLVSDTISSALLNPVIAVRNRLVLQPSGYNYCYGALLHARARLSVTVLMNYLSSGMWDGLFRLVQEEGIFIPGATTVAISRALWHCTYWSASDMLKTLNASWDIESLIPSSLEGAAEGLMTLLPSIAADTLTYPLTTIRTRQHLISDFFAPKSLYAAKQTAHRGIFRTANSIVRSEGLVGLYRGLAADLVGSTIRFYTIQKFYSLVQRFVAWQKASPSMNDNKRWWLQFGLGAAFVTTLIAFDVAPQLESLRSFVYA